MVYVFSEPDIVFKTNNFKKEIFCGIIVIIVIEIMQDSYFSVSHLFFQCYTTARLQTGGTGLVGKLNFWIAWMNAEGNPSSWWPSPSSICWIQGEFFPRIHPNIILIISSIVLLFMLQFCWNQSFNMLRISVKPTHTSQTVNRDHKDLKLVSY